METNDKLKTSTYFSLITLGLVTFIYSIIRTRLISNIPDTNALSIAGHIEWFDLFNEVLQTALIFPLYYIFNKRKDEFKSVIGKTFIISNSIYILFSILILIYCRIIVSNMTDKNILEVTTYLNLETIAFIINNFINFFMVILIFINKAKYFYLSCLLKTVFIIIGDLYLIPKFQVNGVAFSNILVNLLILIFCLFVLYKEDLFPKFSLNFDKALIKDYFYGGSFIGLQIILDNLIYVLIVGKMITTVNEQGNYWVANNVIWGLLLIPIMSLGDIIKKEANTLTNYKIKYFSKVVVINFILFLIYLIFSDAFLEKVMQLKDYTLITSIIKVSTIFYLFYMVSLVVDNIFIAQNQSKYLFYISVIVNLIYYPIIYYLVKINFFITNINFICYMFGIGMFIHMLLSFIFLYSTIKSKKIIISK